MRNVSDYMTCGIILNISRRHRVAEKLTLVEILKPAGTENIVALWMLNKPFQEKVVTKLTWLTLSYKVKYPTSTLISGNFRILNLVRAICTEKISVAGPDKRCNPIVP